MRPRRILIVYATSYGQTAKIAHRMADVLTAAGETVTIVNATDPPPPVATRAFDGIIIGGSIIRGRHQPQLANFVRARREMLNAMPSAFFSVSGSAASSKDAERAAARLLAAVFLDQTGWNPAMTDTIGGAIAYTKYNPLLRWIIRRATRAAGGPTDTSRDHEATDWSQVERFATSFAAKLPSIPTASFATA